MSSPRSGEHAVVTDGDWSALRQQIAPLAFEKWLIKGCPPNSQLQDWLEAEAELAERKRAEEALKNSEALYHSLVENLPQCIYRKDRNGHFTFSNERFAASLGKPAGEILDKTDFDFYPWKLAQKYRHDDEIVLATGKPFEAVEQHVTPDGEKAYVQVVKTPIRDFRGQIVGTQGIFWDVTEKKRAEEELRDREQRLELALDAGRMGTWEWHIASGKVEWSANLETIHGLSQGTFAGTVNAVLDQVHPLDRPSVESALATCRAQKTGLHIEYRLVFPDGGIHWVEGRGHLFLDEAGAPERMLGVCMDVTERKQSEQALHKTNDLLQAIMEGTTDAIFVKDCQGRYLMINTPGAHLIQKSVAEVLGKDDTALFSPATAGVIMEGDRRVMAAGEIQTYEDVGTAGGITRTYQSTKGPYRDKAGNVIGLIGISRDVTERKQMERTLHERSMEFRLARQIQQDLLPARPPTIAGFALGGASHPAQETGGDYLDFVPMPADHMGLIVGDASGHGIGAAILMAQARAYLRAFALTHRNVSKILSLVNLRLVEDSGESHFVTLLFARLHPPTRRLFYCNAGHLPAFVFNAAGEIKMALASTGIPLGLDPKATFPHGPSLVLEPGDLVFFLTDGIVEAFAADDRPFGIERALQLVRDNRKLPPADIVATLLNEVRQFSADAGIIDDRTAIILKAE